MLSPPWISPSVRRARAINSNPRGVDRIAAGCSEGERIAADHYGIHPKLVDPHGDSHITRQFTDELWQGNSRVLLPICRDARFQIQNDRICPAAGGLCHETFLKYRDKSAEGHITELAYLSAPVERRDHTPARSRYRRCLNPALGRARELRRAFYSSVKMCDASAGAACPPLQSPVKPRDLG